MKYLAIVVLLVLSVACSGCMGNAFDNVIDSDHDGLVNSEDAFPTNSKYSVDTDEDGVPDELDEFPDEERYRRDGDGDGVPDKLDDFPDDPAHYMDSDEDGVADEEDDFPDDPLYSRDVDGDGVADELDALPMDRDYSEICSPCGGLGYITYDHERTLRYTSTIDYDNKGIFNPDYYITVVMKNTDIEQGSFGLYVWAERDGEVAWSETPFKRILGAGEEWVYAFHYDADEEVDGFYHEVTAPEYYWQEQMTCTKCNGEGYI